MAGSRAIGFIGLGRMGEPMARRLVRAGHRLTVCNRTAAKCAPLVAEGARAAGTPREAAAGADIVFTMVPATADVEEALLGPSGAVRGASPGAVFVDTSTISPDGARRIARELRSRAIGFLDAPVTGMDVGAREGTLSIMVGGEEADLERVRDVLEVLGRRITLMGPPGAGQVAKACNQILCSVNMVGLCEALHLARLSGLDPERLLEALQTGAGGSWALQHFGPKIARGDFQPGGRLALMLKDLAIIREEASRVGLPVEGAAVAARYFEDNVARGEAALGTQAMYKAVGRAVR
jgi:3-hydroxyisobutyrate dehydrogenase